MTITEALAEIKTVAKRIASKREFIETYQVRLDSLKDPLEKDGGSAKAVAEAEQAIGDLEDRIVFLRSSIQKANDSTTITVEGVEKSISDWLIWRREVAPSRERFLSNLANKLHNARLAVQGKSYQWGNDKSATEKAADVVVNIDEAKLSADKERMKNILGQLDGQLSLKNATVMI